jgi:Tfp pilus assembly protein PilF
MTDHQLLAGLKVRLSDGSTPTAQELAFVKEAVRTMPQSAELWFLHAQAHSCCEDEEGCFDAVSLESYQKCIELDPNHAEAHEHLGHYFDGVKDNPEKAMEHYQKAAELRATARV